MSHREPDAASACDCRPREDVGSPRRYERIAERAFDRAFTDLERVQHNQRMEFDFAKRSQRERTSTVYGHDIVSIPEGALRVPGTPRARLTHLAVLLAVSLLFLFVKFDMPLLDPDEGLYASIAQEMLSRGDWVIPHMNGLPYLEKPPLYFWLTALTFRVFGASEWAVRLWSALATLGTVLLTWRIGRRLYGARAGLLAGIAMTTCTGSGPPPLPAPG